MLEEVGDSALVFLLVQAARVDEEAEGGAALGLGVAQDDVAQAVVEFSEAGGRVGPEVAILVGEAGRGRGQGEGAQQERGEQAGGEGHRREQTDPPPKG